MLYSMTGFGKATGIVGNKMLLIEVRALNSKNLDLTIRLPQIYREREIGLRKTLAARLGRGKIDLSISADTASGTQYGINETAFLKYVETLKRLRQQSQLPDDADLVTTVMRIPDVLITEKEEVGEAEWQQLFALIDKAINALLLFRETEGKALEKDLATQVKQIEGHLTEVEKRAPVRVERVRKRLQAAVYEFMDDDKVDANRFEQELIYYLEKLDLNEEFVRLRSHCDYFLRELAASSKVKGKKLGFISQEMGREINTIGSKANDADMQHHIIKMKHELEKIKEQMLNVV